MMCAGLVSLPRKIELRSNALMIYVQSFWWRGVKHGVRAMTLGNVVLLSSMIEKNDIEHELIHVEQHMRKSLIHPFLSLLEQLRYGHGLENKYEKEAYIRAGNKYKEI